MVFELGINHKLGDHGVCYVLAKLHKDTVSMAKTRPSAKTIFYMKKLPKLPNDY